MSIDTSIDMNAFDMPAHTEAETNLLKKYKWRVTGGSSHTLDTKGRVVIPQVFRGSLGNSFVIAPSQDFTAICLYSELEWAKVRDRYEQYGNNSKIRKFLVVFDAFSYRNQEFDSQGRILIPLRIRKQILGEVKDIDITGANNCVRITTTENFEELVADVMGSIPDIQETINQADSRLLNT